MPMQRCERDGRPGWKWGDAGTCYLFAPDDQASEQDARRKAMAQAAAMGEHPGMADRAKPDAWELRVTAGLVELRDAPGGGKMAVGYAFRYGHESENLGGFVETVTPGAATRAIQENDLRALFNHAPDNLLGRMGAGTLRVEDDDVGLGYQVDLPDTSLGRDLTTLIGRSDIYGSSFTFKTVGARGAVWGKTDRGFPKREIRAMKMRDVGPVTFPAYPTSNVELRSLPELAEAAEARSLPFEEVIAAAADGRLAELLGGDPPPVPPPHRRILAIR